MTCPCCGANTPLDPETVARLITAVAYLPSHVPTNPTVRNAMRAVVEGQEIDRGLIYGEKHRGMHVPRRVYTEAEVAPAVVEAMTKSEPATVTPKSEPIIPTKRRPSIAVLAAADDEDD